MKLFSEDYYGRVVEVEIDKDQLINAIKNEENLITLDGKTLKFWGKRNSRGLASFKMTIDEYSGGSCDFTIVFDADKFRYEYRPKNTVVELDEEDF